MANKRMRPIPPDEGGGMAGSSEANFRAITASSTSSHAALFHGPLNCSPVKACIIELQSDILIFPSRIPPTLCLWVGRERFSNSILKWSSSAKTSSWASKFRTKTSITHTRFPHWTFQRNSIKGFIGWVQWKFHLTLCYLCSLIFVLQSILQ